MFIYLTCENQLNECNDLDQVLESGFVDKRKTFSLFIIFMFLTNENKYDIDFRVCLRKNYNFSSLL